MYPNKERLSAKQQRDKLTKTRKDHDDSEKRDRRLKGDMTREKELLEQYKKVKYAKKS